MLQRRNYSDPDILIAADNLALDIKEQVKKETEGVGKPQSKGK